MYYCNSFSIPTYRYFNKLIGLTGNFNGKALDEFTSPQGSPESNVCDFTNTWAMNDMCEDVMATI